MLTASGKQLTASSFSLNDVLMVSFLLACYVLVLFSCGGAPQFLHNFSVCVSLVAALFGFNSGSDVDNAFIFKHRALCVIWENERFAVVHG